jgi:N-methylhydantoinase A/oxoprolinase/acetone carboxylase beta subunit
MSKPHYIIGIDTGGTYTDAAIIDPVLKKVLCSAKAITTKGDYAIGVGEAMAAALKQAAHITGQQIAMVSVSTTLATNAVVEGHGSPVASLLIGFDDAMVERTKIAASFPGLPIIRIAGGHDHSGDEREKLDVVKLVEAVGKIKNDVAAIAVSSTFAVRNAAHEKMARDIIARETGLPVTLSTELSSALDAPRRALTAVLNARLISRITQLVKAVQSAMTSLDIDAPLMIVKGDGSLARAQSVAQHPIETVLSGPAASLIGAKWLTGLDDLIMSDMGGTTTDIGVLLAGRPKVAEQGAEVGGWRTMVKAIDIKTIGLGGDSEVHIGLNGALDIGPQRAVPISLIGARYPEVKAMLEGDLAEKEGGSLLGKFLLLPFGARQQSAQSAQGLTEREAEIFALVAERPVALRRVAVSSAAMRAVHALRKKGLIQFASLTPSDCAHVLGRQANWSADTALLATKLATRFRDMKVATDERAQGFAQEVWSKTVALSARAILETLVPAKIADGEIVSAVCEGRPDLGLARVSIVPRYPIVAVGGPVKVYYEELARRLEAQVMFADHCEVANAVGAAAGLVSHRVSYAVEGDGKGLFRVQGQGTSEVFMSGAAAIAAAISKAEAAALAVAAEHGAFEAQVKSEITRHLLPDAKDDDGLLSAEIIAEASGKPAV